MMFNYKKDLLLLAPTLLMLLAVWVFFGAEPKHFFTAYREEHPVFTGYMLLFTQNARFIFYFFFVYMAYTGVRDKSWKPLCYILSVVVVQVVMSVILLHTLKWSIGRPRPLFDGPFQPFGSSDNYYSMPSGHTMESAILGITHSRFWQYTVIYLLSGILIALIAFSRIYLSMHHISDILAGLGLAYIGTTLLQYFLFVRASGAKRSAHE